jgi:hypothetical protein
MRSPVCSVSRAVEKGTVIEIVQPRRGAKLCNGGIVMNDMNLLWVLGHKIRLTDTDDSYGLIEVTSLPKVPGPPLHYHKAENEFFS